MKRPLTLVIFTELVTSCLIVAVAVMLLVWLCATALCNLNNSLVSVLGGRGVP